jgi:hypothetical protein
MFDRGLVSLGDPPYYPILLSSDALPDSVRRLFNPDLLLRKPADQRFWPSPRLRRVPPNRGLQGLTAGRAAELPLTPFPVTPFPCSEPELKAPRCKVVTR